MEEVRESPTGYPLGANKVPERFCQRDGAIEMNRSFVGVISPKNATTAFQDALQTATPKLIELMGKARDVSRDDKEQFEPQRRLD